MEFWFYIKFFKNIKIDFYNYKKNKIKKNVKKYKNKKQYKLQWIKMNSQHETLSFSNGQTKSWLADNDQHNEIRSAGINRSASGLLIGRVKKTILWLMTKKK